MNKALDTDLPKNFIDRIKRALGNDYSNFYQALQERPPVSIRYNPHKYTPADIEKISVPWCSNAYYLNERPQFYKDPLIFGGAYYVQEASSMFVAQALKTCVANDKNVKVLDLCAAPGGKSTLINSMLDADSLLVSNEIVAKRVIPLVENLMRWGNANVIVSNNNPQDFEVLKDFFDVVLVDAPCSGEGMFRKDKKVAQLWSKNLPIACANRQEQILASVDKVLKPGGILIYSTCTFACEENELQINNLISTRKYTSLQIAIENEWGISEKKEQLDIGKVAYSYCFYPHKVKGEGFFLACLQKGDEGYRAKKIKLPKKKANNLELVPKKNLKKLEGWVQDHEKYSFILEDEKVYAFPKEQLHSLRMLDKVLKVRMKGIEMGKLRNNKFIPIHHLAISNILTKDIPQLKLDYTQAIAYLRKLALTHNPDNLQGWVTATYKGVTLGWLKMLPNRINNYYPAELRIQKDFEID